MLSSLLRFWVSVSGIMFLVPDRECWNLSNHLRSPSLSLSCIPDSKAKDCGFYGKMCWTLDSTSKTFPDSGIRIALHGASLVIIHFALLELEIGTD